MAPVKNIAGPPAGLWWLTAVRKGFHCSKMVKTRRFWIKFGRRAGDSYSDVVLALIFSLMVFCEPPPKKKKSYNVPAHSDHILTA